MFGKYQTKMSVDLMLQRQMEVSGGLRNKITTPAELLSARDTMRAMAGFMSQLGRLSTKMQLPLEIVFQCLMHLDHRGGGAASASASSSTNGGAIVDFDKQARQGNVPMHQAKVLDRTATLNAHNVEPKLRETVTNPADVDKLVAECRTLRAFLKTKMEDGADLSIARKMVTLADEYFECIFSTANGDAAAMFRLYSEGEPDALAKLVAELSGTGDGADDGSSGGGGAHSGGGASASPRLPASLVKGIESESRCLATTKAPVEQRQGALDTIGRWIRDVPTETLADDIPAVFAALAAPLKVHLAEKRSALCRAACFAVSELCIRCPVPHFSNPKVREVITSWAQVLVGGVHDSVGAIAQPTDETLRDIIVATQGAGFLLSLLCHTAIKTQKVEQRRKCLGFVAAAMVVTKDKTNLASLCHVSNTLVGSNDDGTRRIARCVGILLQIFDPAAAANLVWDARVAKLAEQEHPLVSAMCGSIAEFETKVLKYAAPCRASLTHEERQGEMPRSTSVFATGASPKAGATPAAAAAHNTSVSSDGVTSKRNRLEPDDGIVETADDLRSGDKATNPSAGAPIVTASRTTRPTIAELRDAERKKKLQQGGGGAPAAAATASPSANEDPIVVVTAPRKQVRPPRTADPSSASAATGPALNASDACSRQPERRVASALPLSLQPLSSNTALSPGGAASCGPQPPLEPTTPSEISALCSSLKRKRASQSREGSVSGPPLVPHEAL